MTIRRLTALVTLWGLPWALAVAEPLTLEQVRDQAIEFAAPAAHEETHDVQAWIHRETTTAMLDGVSQRGRQLLLLQSWQARAPTWIQSAATVNLGDFPNLDDPTATAERDLQTLQWVLEDQRRLAAGRAAAQRGADGPAAPEDNWWRQLLPRHWVPVLKANREWVAAGGTALLVIVWAMAAFSRRPGAPPSVEPPQTRPPPVRRRRRHRSSGSQGTRPAELRETARLRG
jgi:hypothetical protein